MINQMLAIWSLVPLPFLKPAWTSGSSQFTKLGLENFENYFTSILDEFEHSLALPFFGIGMKIDHFQSCGHCWVFQIFWHIECGTFTASSFRIWNSSTGISSPPLALFVVMLPKAHLSSHCRCLALGAWSHHRDYLGCEDLFVQFFCVFLPPLLNIFCFC